MWLQVSQPIRGNVNQEAEAGRETQTQVCMTKLWKRKTVSAGESTPLKKICLTVFCQMWYLEENLGVYQNARDSIVNRNQGVE